MPFNANKPREYDPAAAIAPKAGQSLTPGDPVVTASTVTETNASEKVGSGAPTIGNNKTIGPLDRVRVDSTNQPLTTNQGVPIGDNQSSLKAGLRGPTLLEDFILREKITHFDHERIPERIVHARGSAAHGYFECYKPLEEVHSRASLFSEAGKQTPVFVRFSTVLGERGSTDTARDVRGFAVKFYTDEGNWDLVGNNIPIFFIQDAMKFPDLVHAAKPEPHFAMPQAGSAHDTFWDFASLMPEITAMLMWAMSDRAIPRSYRTMQGFGVHTFRLVNAAGESHFVKFHWSPLAGTHSLVWDEAVKISGADSDFHRRDLWEAIEAGAYPEYELGVQIFTEEQAEGFTFDVLDPTKIVPEELVPVVPVGKLVLNRNPDNFFAETEQVAFCAAHIVPGIDFSNDPLLAGRIHSYVDTQISRLGGANFHEIPDQRAARAGAQQPARRHAPAGASSRPGLLRAQLARRRLPVSGGRGGVRAVRGADRARGAQGARKARALRRSLHAGHALLEQPDAGREDAHHQRLPLRVVARADAGGAGADGVRADERRSGAGRGGSRKASASGPMPAPMPKALKTKVKPEVRQVAGAVVVCPSWRRQHPRASRRDPRRGWRRRRRVEVARRAPDRGRSGAAVRRPASRHR